MMMKLIIMILTMIINDNNYGENNSNDDNFVDKNGSDDNEIDHYNFDNDHERWFWE